MHLHILGICGTFMGGLAVLASELKNQVSGSDLNVYPPMSTQLAALGINILSGYGAEQLNPQPDCVVVGNVVRRGMPVVEALMESQLPFMSGPEWLAKKVLKNRHVLAVSGTHGKTTTSSMLAWILEFAGLNPGFLIGGIPNNFGISARLGTGHYFVVEADEYDSAFFDKRSKFVHYWPKTLIINNIEFDHADIFPNLAAIQQQFHHLVRTVPGKGLIIHPRDQTVMEVLKKGCWSQQVAIDKDNHSGWHTKNATVMNDHFEVWFENQSFGSVHWSLMGEHNVMNALAAIAAAHHVGVDPKQSIEALSQFSGVKRRMEVKGIKQGITVVDDFAHHPTAIKTTLEGLRAKVGSNVRIIAVVDIRSNTMRAGHHKSDLAKSVQAADVVYYYQSPDIQWDVESIWKTANRPGGVFLEEKILLDHLVKESRQNDQVIFMSNGGFGGIQNAFLEAL